MQPYGLIQKLLDLPSLGRGEGASQRFHLEDDKPLIRCPAQVMRVVATRGVDDDDVWADLVQRHLDGPLNAAGSLSAQSIEVSPEESRMMLVPLAP